MKQIIVDKLTVHIARTREEMGKLAANDIAGCIRKELKEKEFLNIIFAAAPSQNEMLKYLIMQDGIDWSKIHAFHMDEYLGLPENSTASFAHYLDEHIFGKVAFRNIYYIQKLMGTSEEKCTEYSNLLSANPPDIVLLGIGENGHIAFNDPPVADFNDEKKVKIVDLDFTCRNQQVHDGCFAKLDDVPKQAITLTIPVLFQAKHLFCTVPAATKARAVREMLTTNQINEHSPASILRMHDSAMMYCDRDSASEIGDLLSSDSVSETGALSS